MKNFWEVISFCKYFKVSKHKGFEIQIDFNNGITNEWLQINLASRSKQDHAGFIFEFCILKFFSFILHFYYSRHWDYENNCFEDPNKPDEYKRYSKKDPELPYWKIVVSNEEEKENLIKASEYIHSFMVKDRFGNWVGLDEDILWVSALMHLYVASDFIIVDETLKN